ncbi:hypothetical protein EVA_09339 [gut metagenome]|uniref:Uncharacterized protein n=1 Tax=gut metagenome TaxID=749906 RepID=J9CQY5_9ZZZZ
MIVTTRRKYWRSWPHSQPSSATSPTKWSSSFSAFMPNCRQT